MLVLMLRKTWKESQAQDESLSLLRNLVLQTLQNVVLCIPHLIKRLA